MKKRGISLIVLIITIIIMIILATVMITSLKNAGIVDKAKEAKKESNKNAIIEAANLSYSTRLLKAAGDKSKVNGSDVKKDIINSGISKEDVEKYYIDVGDGGLEVYDLNDDEHHIEYTIEEATSLGWTCDAEGTLTGCPSNLTGKLIIPAKIGDINITKIGAELFFGNDNITEIWIPYGITEVGSYAFSSIHAVKKIVLPDSLLIIKAGAFQLLINLENIILPQNLKIIEDDAFARPNNDLKGSINIPSTIEKIGDYAFRGFVYYTINIYRSEGFCNTNFEPCWNYYYAPYARITTNYISE